MSQQLPIPPHQDVHFQDYLKVIVRRRKSLVITFLVVAIALTTGVFLVRPLFESAATVFVKDDQGKVGQMGDLLLNGPTPVESEIEIMKARGNAEKVVSKHHLDWEVDGLSAGVDFKMLEFASTEDDPTYYVQLLGDGAYSVKDDRGDLVGNGKSGVLLRSKGLSLLINDLKGAKGESFRLILLPFDETVAALRKKIKIAEVGKNTNVISIAYRNHNPKLARDVVNTLVQAYLDKGVALKSESASRTVGFVAEQLKGVKTELEDAEKNLAAYKSSAGVMELDESAQALIDSLSEVEKQKAEAVLHRKQVEFALTSLKNARAKGAVYSPAITADDPVLSGMASRLSELEVQKKGLLADSTESHPGVKLVQNQIDELQKKIQSTFETTLRNDIKKVEALSQEIARRDASLKKLPAAERDLARLMRLTKVNSDIYTLLLQKHEEARIAQASTINNISIVDPAIAANKPVFPKKTREIPLIVVVALMCSVGVCFLREFMDDTLKDPEHAKTVFALPLLAVIPYIAKKEGLPALICHNAPKSPASEAFRALRTGLHFSVAHSEKKVLLVTSSIPGEGKSTISSNLAITLAQAGARVLLIDCDLRRSTLHDNFGFDRKDGLTELLVGDVSLEAAITATEISGLDLLKSGVQPPNPSEILGSASMASFIGGMKERYDYVVIDAPPIIAVTDAAVLSSLADLVVMVFEAGRVPAKVGLRTREILASVSAPLVGFVASDRSADRIDYGYRYQYGPLPEKGNRWWRFGKGERPSCSS